VTHLPRGLLVQRALNGGLHLLAHGLSALQEGLAAHLQHRGPRHLALHGPAVLVALVQQVVAHAEARAGHRAAGALAAARTAGGPRRFARVDEQRVRPAIAVVLWAV